MRSATLTLAASSLLLSSCAGMVKRRGTEMAAAQLQCPAEQVTFTPSTDARTPAKAEGCGKSDQAISHCITSQGGSMGGGASYASSCAVLWFSSAVDQAAFTTKCPKEQVTTEWLAPNLGVDACGERMTFTPTLSGWVLNTTSAPAGG